MNKPTRRRAVADAAETLKDAEAIVRILGSPRVPQSVKLALGEALDVFKDEHSDTSPPVVAAILTAASEDE